MCTFGPPDHTTMDQGKKYISKGMRTALDSAGVIFKEAPTEHPRTIGTVEQYHATNFSRHEDQGRRRKKRNAHGMSKDDGVSGKDKGWTRTVVSFPPGIWNHTRAMTHDRFPIPTVTRAHDRLGNGAGTERRGEAQTRIRSQTRRRTHGSRTSTQITKVTAGAFVLVSRTK